MGSADPESQEARVKTTLGASPEPQPRMDNADMHVRQAGALQANSLLDFFADWFACPPSRFCRARLPIARWLPQYRWKEQLAKDAIAGTCVGLTVVPQALAFAYIADVPLHLGLYASFIGCAVYVLFGTAKDVSVGPTAIVSLMTASAVADIEDLNERGQYAVLLSFLAGCMQILMGALNLGFLIRFISTPVIGGFVSAASLIIAATQLRHLLGIELEHPRHGFVGQFRDVIDNYDAIEMPNAGLGAACLVVLTAMHFLGIALERRLSQGEDSGQSSNKRALLTGLQYAVTARNGIVIVISTMLVMVLDNLYGSSLGIRVTGTVPAGIPSPHIPAFSIGSLSPFETLERLGTGGVLMLVLVSLLESIAVAKAFSVRNHYRIDATQEFIAIGLCNVAAGLVGGYAIGGSIARTALNSQSGAQTALGGLVTSAMVLLTLAFLTTPASMIPSAALAAVIIAVALPMFNWREPRALWNMRKLDLLPFLVTFVACLTLGIKLAMAAGVAVSIAVLLLAEARPEILVETHDATRKIVVTPQRPLYFPAADYIQNIVQEAIDSLRTHIAEKSKADQTIRLKSIAQVRPMNTDLHIDGDVPPASQNTIGIVLDTRLLLDADSSCVNALKALIQSIEGDSDCALYFRNLPAWLRKELRSVGIKKIGRDGWAEEIAADEAPPKKLSIVAGGTHHRADGDAIRVVTNCTHDCHGHVCHPHAINNIGDVLYP